MARPNRFQIMDLHKDDIISALESHNEQILTLADVENTLIENKMLWKLPQSTTVNQFLEYLLQKRKLLKEIEFGPNSRREKRFLYNKNKVSPQNLALLLYPNSYLSHFSAVMYHDLTDEIVKSIYINKEQSEKQNNNRPQKIPQQNIDKAFSKPMRTTNNFFDYNEQRIYILNGKYTNNLGVIEREGVRVTDIERTLIDITVRPQYSGGVYEVLNIFKKAKKLASVTRMVAYLKQLNYSYPYHQAIGFYLEKAGFKENVLALIEKKFSFENDFYLTYNIKEQAYNKRWRIYYPTNL